ncbi:MAG: hypothetical protein KatS3mg063_0377 [Tepidiforma sp.]|nr:MAG: hypothetical protein KatS3mg063_0377 [Tepidiforma sp.]
MRGAALPPYRIGQSVARELHVSFRRRDLLYLAALALGSGLAYIAFRELYLAGAYVPYAQEMVLIFLGAVATIILTAALLNRQTELELRKEGRVLVFQQKSDIYMACIETVARIVQAEALEPRLIDELRVLNHKLAVVGSAEVVAKFDAVLRGLLEGLADGRLAALDGERVMSALADLTAAMRGDILEEAGLAEPATLLAIRRNAARMEELDDLGGTPEQVAR